MHSLNILLFAFAATSYAFPGMGSTTLEVRKDHNGTQSNGGDSTKRACNQIQKLTHLTELAANQTKLDELVAKGKMNATEVDELKNKAAEASTKLQTMESNTTLTSECAVIDAEKKTVQECKKMKKLQKLANLASNTTALDAMVAKKQLNSTQVDKLKEKIQGAQTKLQTMSSNTTLTDFCAQRKQDKSGADTEASSTDSAGAAGSATAEQTSTNGAGGLSMSSASINYVLYPAAAAAFFLIL
ncbi:hypothetical protein FB567DRAFT_91810 [Paraphoma chrysanthemicola]|uniref:Cell wall protein n=1 Tax=Paraphoma chrysanthemicola TaxID=798071 RepID=A0A8K0R281_9PLEO|nr:hypothetical protein FB567DRAFT_91810 [Paraphoma chrysanthemicola]